MTATLEQISNLLKHELASLKSELKEELASLKNELKSDVSSLKSDVSSLKDDVSSLKDDVARLSHTVGSLVDANRMNEARRKFGESYVKDFCVRSLHDAVCLLTQAQLAGFVSLAARQRPDAAIRLARTAKSLAIPLAKAVRLSYPNRLETTVKSAEEAFDDEDYSTALGILISQAQQQLSAGDDDSDICLSLKRIAKAFPSDQTIEEDDLERFLSCEGPGVMLVELATRYTAAELEVKEDLFDDVLHGWIEVDLRRITTIVIEAQHSTVAHRGEKTKSSSCSSFKQLHLRTRFLDMIVGICTFQIIRG